MTILDPSARRWDVTPKRRIVTTSHRIAFDPELGARVTAAQAVQSAVYDATLEHLDRHGPVPWIVLAGGADSVLKWLTRERRQHPEWSLALERRRAASVEGLEPVGRRTASPGRAVGHRVRPRRAGAGRPSPAP